MVYRANFGVYADDPLPWFVNRFCTAMPLSDDVRKTALFIGVRKDDVFHPRATGFFVTYTQEGLQFLHLVTAEHVVSGLLGQGHKIFGRANLKNGETGEFEIPGNKFYFHPDENNQTDVAVCSVGDSFVRDPDTGSSIEIDLRTIPLNGPRGISATDKVIEDERIGIGDEVAAVGLFRSHAGREKNVPIVRIGNISAMRDEPVYTEYAGFIDAYLIELRSISGLSGSPVLLLNPPYRLVPSRENPKVTEIISSAGKPSFYLLGLVHGHFDIKNLNEDTVVEDQAGALSSINTGIGLVIPVQKIIETVEHPDLMKLRKERIEADKKKRGAATADFAPDDSAVHAIDVNPQHLEDFKSLVGEAARKQK